MTKARRTETETVQQTLALLALYGIPAWRNNTGGFHSERADGGTAYVQFNEPGASDVLGVIPPHGRFLAVEVKRPGKRPTPAQWAFLLRVQKAGGVALWIDDPATLAGLLDRIKAGYVIETDEHGRLFLTDESRTADHIQPPTETAHEKTQGQAQGPNPPHRNGDRGR